MIFLPIVERELRVASRRRVTYWGRLVAAAGGAGLAAWILIVFSNAGAPNGAAGLHQLAHIRPRLILLDLNMPVMDGASFRERQLLDESLAAIPTIIMTARANPGAAAGPLFARACLVKPIDLDELLALVSHYCGSG